MCVELEVFRVRVGRCRLELEEVWKILGKRESFGSTQGVVSPQDVVHLEVCIFGDPRVERFI